MATEKDKNELVEDEGNDWDKPRDTVSEDDVKGSME